MDVELVDFVGAGLALWATGLDADVPEQSFSRGVDVVRGLAAHGDRERVEAIVDQVVRDIWQEWRNSRRSRSVFIAHLAQLPGLIKSHRPSAGAMTNGLVEAGKARRSGGGVDLIAHRLASDIILGARAAGQLDGRGLDETLCFFLLVRLLASLLSRSDKLMGLRDAFDATFGRPSPRSGSSTAATAVAVAATGEPAAPAEAQSAAADATASAPQHPDVLRLAEANAIPVAVLDAAVTARSAAGRTHLDAMDLETAAADYVAIRAIIDEAPHEAKLAEARAALELGRLTAAEAALADGEKQAASGKAVVAADVDFEAAQRRFDTAFAWRVLRARLAELAGDGRAAARHLAHARTLAGSAARQVCGSLLIRQAGVLVTFGIEHDDEKALIEAAQVYAEAGGFLSEHSAPMDWAAAHVDLGHLLLVLGDREERPERFLAAALHFKPAVDVYLRHHALDQWAHAQVGLARALKRTGEFQGDVETLGEAAFAFRAALGVLTKDRTPQDWVDAQLGLAESLVRIAEETGEATNLQDAVPALRAVLAQPGDCGSRIDVTAAQAALGRAYAGLASQRQDEAMLQEAITLLESALDSGARALSKAEQAVVEQVRGTALWSLGEARASVRMLEDAMRAKLNAVELNEALGDMVGASRLREDLDDLAEAIQRLAGAAPKTAFTAETARAS